MRIDDAIFNYASRINATRSADTPATGKTEENKQANGQSFADLLAAKMNAGGLTFSKHAMQRVAEREMDLSAEDVTKLNDAAKRAGAKGLDNTLVLTGKGAFIINVSHNVVVTAMNNNDMKENVFTQIDGAVII